MRCAALLFALLPLVWGSAVYAHYGDEPSPLTTRRIVALRRAGLAGDRRKAVAGLAALLRRSTPTSEAVSALHALAVLDDGTVVARLEKAIRESGPAGWEGYARIVIARRTVEKDAARRPKSNAASVRKIETFLRLLRVSVKDLNDSRAARDRRRFEIDHWQTPISLEIRRELADMIYRNEDPYLAAAAAEKGISFASDPPAALKVRLRTLPRPGKVRALIDDLARRKALDLDADATVQAAVEEDLLAARTAGARLKEMYRNRRNCPDAGLLALLQVIEEVGDTSQADAAALFLKDRDPWVRDRARSCLAAIRPRGALSVVRNRSL